jgi:hypothetical protein
MPSPNSEIKIDAMTYRELQTLAKKHSIRANQKAEILKTVLKKTLSSKSSPKSSSSKTRKHRQSEIKLVLNRLLTRDDIIDIDAATIIQKMYMKDEAITLLKNESRIGRRGNGELFFNYDNANIKEIMKNQKTSLSKITTDAELLDVLKMFKTQKIDPLYTLTSALIDAFDAPTDKRHDEIRSRIAEIQTTADRLLKRFNIYLDNEYVKEEINDILEDYNEQNIDVNPNFKKFELIKQREIKKGNLSSKSFSSSSSSSSSSKKKK